MPEQNMSVRLFVSKKIEQSNARTLAMYVEQLNTLYVYTYTLDTMMGSSRFLTDVIEIKSTLAALVEKNWDHYTSFEKGVLVGASQVLSSLSELTIKTAIA